MYKNAGKQTLIFGNDGDPASAPRITACASIVGPKEGEGPLGRDFDVVSQDIMFGKDTWEKAESEVARQAVEMAANKAGLRLEDIRFVLAGDLLNQCIGSSFGMRAVGRPFFGLFGACSTFGEALVLGAALVDGGWADHVISSASSHFCSAEKTFRFPLELGTQRTPTASWTVTGDGAAVVSAFGDGPRITAATAGKIVDMGIKDVSNMGAAMAPAVADTLTRHFADMNAGPDHYDVIATGDLGRIGKELLIELMFKEGYDLTKNFTDCGVEIYGPEQDAHAGGSGCACAAVTFSGHFYKKLTSGKIGKMLLVPTGALMNQTTAMQGESIPSIAHAVRIEGMQITDNR
ncbi:MAG: stage V sporulation protein AD [Firmicutes bacterium]|nr:stage V sporulation protein AD [Bacillota bacterium]